MKHTQETLAWLLAADEHPHLKHEQGYQSAQAELQASPDVQAQLDEARAFNQKYPELFAFNTLPADVRLRIANALALALSIPAAPEKAPVSAAEQVVSPWSYRQQFAWAAVLALFLAGLSVISSRIIEQQSPQSPSYRQPQMARQPDALPEFHRFVSHSLVESPGFQHQDHDTVQLVSWLGEQDAFAPPLPESIARAPGMGCAVLESPHGNISMICVELHGQKLKLFIACSKALRAEPHSPEALQIDRHEAIEWSNEDNVFLLIQSRPDTPMPEIML